MMKEEKKPQKVHKSCVFVACQMPVFDWRLVMVVNLAVAADKEAAQECAAEDGHEVSNVHGHDSQHAAEEESQR